METLNSKIAIVTGGGTGIGKSIALALAHQGVNVVICGRRLEALMQTAEEADKSNGRIIPVQADSASEEGVNRVIKTTLETFNSRIDVLVNNAGITGGTYIHKHDVEDWDRVMAINLRGPFLMARAVLPLMRSQFAGHIINISSESGLEYYEGDGAYGVAKHGLVALGELIQRENQAFGIQVNTVCPGMVVTEMTSYHKNLIHEKSLFPEDIADLVIWLLTRRANIKIGRTVLIQTMENPWM